MHLGRPHQLAVMFSQYFPGLRAAKIRPVHQPRAARCTHRIKSARAVHPIRNCSRASTQWNRWLSCFVAQNIRAEAGSCCTSFVSCRWRQTRADHGCGYGHVRRNQLVLHNMGAAAFNRVRSHLVIFVVAVTLRITQDRQIIPASGGVRSAKRSANVTSRVQPQAREFQSSGICHRPCCTTPRTGWPPAPRWV